jgi:anti-sigma factor RsiW
MTCRELSDFLADYVAGELAASVQAEFEGHLGSCGDCHAFVMQYRATIALSASAFDEGPGEAIPDDLVRAILSALGRGDA